jgi:hypothetical protein
MKNSGRVGADAGKKKLSSVTEVDTPGETRVAIL